MSCVDSVFSCLQSEFMVLPGSPSFVEYPVLEKGYEALSRIVECTGVREFPTRPRLLTWGSAGAAPQQTRTFRLTGLPARL